jgi:hypothetical protein
MTEYIFNDEIVDNDNLPEDIKPYSDGRPIYKVTGELIRCKDCKHRPTINGEYENGFSLEFPTSRCPCQCDDGYYSWMPKDDWYCANAERKE